jgi:hypothetical protein
MRRDESAIRLDPGAGRGEQLAGLDLVHHYPNTAQAFQRRQVQLLALPLG